MGKRGTGIRNPDIRQALALEQVSRMTQAAAEAQALTVARLGSAVEQSDALVAAETRIGEALEAILAILQNLTFTSDGRLRMTTAGGP